MLDERRQTILKYIVSNSMYIKLQKCTPIYSNRKQISGFLGLGEGIPKGQKKSFGDEEYIHCCGTWWWFHNYIHVRRTGAI